MGAKILKDKVSSLNEAERKGIEQRIEKAAINLLRIGMTEEVIIGLSIDKIGDLGMC